jgi:signal transduction histidine kinase
VIRAGAVRVVHFFRSMAGRVFVMLTIGMTLAAAASLAIAERARGHDFERVRLERVTSSVVDIAQRLRDNPATSRAMLDQGRIWGARAAPANVAIVAPDAHLIALLEAKLGHDAHPEASQVPSGLCFPPKLIEATSRAAGVLDVPLPDCWIVRFTDRAGRAQSLAINLAPLVIPRSSTLDPIYLLVLVAASALLAMVATRIAAAPIRRLEQAARSFSATADREPLPERGPPEVRAALQALNLMQERIREGYRERTQLLAAISHDLQTPLTRLRLRLEQVEDIALRERLIADLSATQALVREGLDLARSSDNAEPWSQVDIDSMLASLAEDASEFGARVAFVSGCGGTVRVKPNALSRCLTNLIDNAVKYGGSAELSCGRRNGELAIAVRDRGAGIPADRLEAMFQPFVRGESSRSRASGGTGIGLTIARAQASTFGGTVTLENHAEGGVLAIIRLAAG